MSSDQALGVLSLAIGLLLFVLQRRILQAWAEREEEWLSTPLGRAMAEYLDARTPRWMRGARYRRRFQRVWLSGVGVLFVGYGIALVTR